MVGEISFLAVLGLAVGSFLTVVVDRYDVAETILAGRSHCNHCQKNLRWWELVPLLSYVMLQGKCARCHKGIPLLYPIFEVITAGAFILVRLAQPSEFSYAFLVLELVFVSYLLVLLFYDWLTQSFPTVLLYIGLAFAAIVGLARDWFLPGTEYFRVEAVFVGWLSTPDPYWLAIVIGLVVGGGFLAALSWPSKGKWMGYGDVFIGAILGLWLGFPLVIVALLVAFYSGAFVGILQIVRRKLDASHRLPFGPFLIVGGLVANTYGDAMLGWLMRLWGVGL